MRQDLSYPPRTTIITRDGLGRVLSVRIDSTTEWTISRDVEGRVESLTDGRFLRTIVRDVGGAVSHVDVVQL